MISSRSLASIFTMFFFYFLILATYLGVSNQAIALQAEPPSIISSSPTEVINDYYDASFEQLFTQLKNRLPQDIFKIANQALATKEYQAAIKIYRVLNSVYPLNEWAEQAQINTIEAYCKEFDVENVTREISKFLTLYPHSQSLEKVYYLGASVYFKPQASRIHSLYKLLKLKQLDPAHSIDTDELSRAMDYFFDFLQRFPSGMYAAWARQNIEEIKQLMARREYYIACFYVKSGNYVAAYNRIVNLFDHYPEIHEILPKRYVTTLNKQYQQAKQQLRLE